MKKRNMMMRKATTCIKQKLGFYMQKTIAGTVPDNDVRMPGHTKQCLRSCWSFRTAIAQAAHVSAACIG